MTDRCESCGGVAIRLPWLAEFGLCSDCYVDFEGGFVCCAVNMEARSSLVQDLKGERLN